jgi:hypothetical protein
LPHNLGQFFPNLEVLFVMKSNVQHLVNGDLNGLNKLKIFDVSFNPIDQICKDFFKDHASIERISFYDCNLKKIANGALDHLPNLSHLFFDHNVCISLRKEGIEKMDKTKLDIYNECEGKNAQLEPSEIDICNPTKGSSSKMMSNVMNITFGQVIYFIYVLCFQK